MNPPIVSHICINCDAQLEEVFVGSAKDYQFRDALDIQIRLGYGEFRDQDFEQIGDPRANFCETCAQKLYDNFPGIRKMVEGDLNA